jgi:hydrogenase nickel incorporation protein HypB
MSVHTVKIVRNVLASNDGVAERNRARFEQAGVLAVNVIAAPGAGKTSLIVRTMEVLRDRARVGVIEGDIAGSIDTERVLAAGAADAVQINTGGNCHLEAHMVQRALDDLDLAPLDVVFIENVGNLVCPTHWALGERVKVCLSSAAEGHDKPVKYPEIFAACDAVVLNKIDLLERVDFEREFFYRALRAVNPAVPVFEVSCRSGIGTGVWADWLMAQRQAMRSVTRQPPAVDAAMSVRADVRRR